MIAAALILAMNPRVYYLFPAFPMLLAAGAVQFERWHAPRLKPVYIALMVAMAAMIAPTLIPLLPPETYIRYAAATHLEQPRIENHKLGPLPQLFADQFGWEDFARVVAGFYRTLPPGVRERTAIYGQSYGHLGAIDLYGPRYGLPASIGGHQNYFLWGPREYTGESMIIIGESQESLAPKFASVQKVGRVEHPYAMPYNHVDIFYCQGLKRPLAEVWPQVKNWH
jgi:hypothetical protein